MRKLRCDVVKSLSRSSFAKCILTGEHSVLFGSKAISIPVPLKLKSRILYTKDNTYKAHLINSNLENKVFTRSELQAFKSEKEKLYEGFIEGVVSIDKVLSNRFDLVNLTLAYLVDLLGTMQGMTIEVNSNIPWGLGMGSSAALVTSILQHTCAQNERVLSLATEIENYAHGKSSGLDPATCLSKKIVIKKNNSIKYKELDMNFWKRFLLIDSGRPVSGTGECVSHSSKFFSDNSSVLSEFDALSSNIALDIENQNYALLSDKINYNQSLLETIGVVPQKVQNFFKDLVRMGGCGKICGAGSIQGDNGGLLLVGGDYFTISKLSQSYNYRIVYDARVEQHVQV